MIFSKKMGFKSLLLALCLGASQESKPLPLHPAILLIPLMGTVAVGYETFVFVTRYNNAYEIAHTQDMIIEYTAYVSAYKRDFAKQTNATFKGNNPETVIKQVLNFAASHTGVGSKVRVCPELRLDNGQSFLMKEIVIRAASAEALEDRLVKRFIIPEKKHLTYKDKIFYAGIPATLGWGLTGFLTSFIYYIV